MKMLFAAALVMAGMMGPVLAQDAMGGNAMAGNAMSGDAMAPAASGDMANTMMTPNDMLAACLKHAAMLADTAAQDAGKKTCNDAMALAMGSPMGGAPMETNGMAADPGAMAPAPAPAM